MGRSVDAIRNFTIQNKMDGSGDHEVILSDTDHEETSWTYSSVSNVYDFFEKAGMDTITAQTLLPQYSEGIVFDLLLEEQEINFLKNLTPPSICLELMEKYELLKKAKENEPNMEFKMEWLKDKWSRGFYVFIND
ncbi:hypothetical protein ABEV55_14735 [Aneurinibacillus thermoaerophilus]|uniref:hypothetical protein n=1 Tax=Aneurinibacillus thermoaerophilus TaxID=143495 RepID=UPI002E22CEC9|nr:hypothetical protein [Aneurinibacillus thermoaerophilus]